MSMKKFQRHHLESNQRPSDLWHSTLTTVSPRSPQKWVPGIFCGCKGGRCVGLTTLPPSWAECLEIWEPQPPGTLRACPSPYRDCFTFACLLNNYAGPSGRAVYGLGLLPLACWDCGFESCWGHRCSSLVFVVCCVGSGFCDGLITHSEESTVCVCEWV
jgi:hypothetical protein